MSVVVQQIKKSMSELTETPQGKIIARFTFSPEFIGFQGHFPDKPILPGVCKIQAVMLILQEKNKKKVRLKEVVLAKFFSSVSCGEKIVFECCEHKENNEKTMVKALVTSKGDKIAELKLRISYY